MLRYKIFPVLILLNFLLGNTSYSQPFSSDHIIDTSAAGLYTQFNGSIDLMRDGTVCISWIDMTTSGTILNFGKSTNHGKTFTKTVVDSLFYPNAEFYNAQIYVDHSGNIWISKETFVDNWLGLSLHKSTDGGMTFSRTFLGSLFSGIPYSLTSDTLGNVYALWRPGGGWLTCTKMQNGNSHDTVNTLIPVPQGVYVDGVYKIAAEENGQKLFVVFAGGVPSGPYTLVCKIYLSVSTDGGITFSSPKQIDTTVSASTNQYEPQILICEDRICIVWADNRDGHNALYYSESYEGSSFSPVVKVSTVDNNIGLGNIYFNRNSKMIGLTWSSRVPLTYLNIYFSQKVITSDSFSVPIQAGDSMYFYFDQGPVGLAIDEEGYGYILFLDNRRTGGLDNFIYLTETKFDLSAADDNYNPPSDFTLYQNYPNPFNPSTIISYKLPIRTKVKLIIYDALGREVTQMLNEEKDAGEYKIKFDALAYNLASGIYFCSLTAENKRSTIKLLFLK